MKFLWKEFNLFIMCFLILTLQYKVKLTKVEVSSSTSTSTMARTKTQHRLEELTQEQLEELNKIKKPDAPDKMSSNMKFMENIIQRSYRQAMLKANPRFLETDKLSAKFKNLFPRDKRQVGVSISRDRYSGESTLPIKNAWSNSVYTFRFLWWWRSYPARNAIYGYSYWCSLGNHSKEDIIIWEAQLYDLTRIHGINIIWAYAPKRYAIEYSGDGSHWKTLIDWRNAITGGNSTWWSKLIPSLRKASRSFPDRITFNNPVFARKIRIIMKGPVNYYFGLYRVDLYVRNWTMVVKNSTTGQCREDCWVLNLLSPKHFDPVKTADCVHTIGYSENRELFSLLYDTRLVHYNTGYCVVSAEDKNKVFLQGCIHAQYHRDGREKFNFWPDGRITPRYAKDECIYKAIDSFPEEVQQQAVVEATSEIASGGHNALRVADGNDGSYWASNPGDHIVTLTLYFKKWMTVDSFNIKWKHKAEDFDVYAYTYENGWKLILRLTKNNKEQTNLKLKRINTRAIQIKMSKTKQKILKLPIYGINAIKISDGAINLRRKKCSKIKPDIKQWVLDDQWYYYIGNKPPYIKAYNELTKTYLRLRILNRHVNLDWIFTQKAKSKANQISKILKSTEKINKKLLEKIKKFKTEKYSHQNRGFLNVIMKYKQPPHYPYDPKPDSGKDQVGSHSSVAGEDCWKIKEIMPFKKSGFYWIRPACGNKPLRVFCDFSIEKIATTIYVWTGDTAPNTPIVNVGIDGPKDIQLNCAKVGLYPIEIKSSGLAERITKYLQMLTYDLSRPIVYPLGYDWSCESGQCSLNFQSYSNKRSKKIFGFFPFPDKNHWNETRREKYNSVGLGYDGRGLPHFFNLNNVKIGALVCSTNTYGPETSDPTNTQLQCSDIFSGNEKVDARIGAKVKVTCPAFCEEKSEHHIYGVDVYSDSSSICRAAVHSGFIEDREGGTVILIVGPSGKNYKGVKKHGLKSLELKGKTSKSFKLEKYNRPCPKELFQSNEQKAAEKNEEINQELTKLDKQQSRERGVNSADPKPKKTPPLQFNEAKKQIPFNDETKGKKSHYDQPKNKPILTKPKDDKEEKFFLELQTKITEQDNDIITSQNELANLEGKEEKKQELSNLQRKNHGLTDEEEQQKEIEKSSKVKKQNDDEKKKKKKKDDDDDKEEDGEEKKRRREEEKKKKKKKKKRRREEEKKKIEEKKKRREDDKEEDDNKEEEGKKNEEDKKENNKEEKEEEQSKKQKDQAENQNKNNMNLKKKEESEDKIKEQIKKENGDVSIFDKLKKAKKKAKNLVGKALAAVPKKKTKSSKLNNASLNAKKGLSKNVQKKLISAKQAADPKTNPSKSKATQKAAKKKPPCVRNTDTCLKEIVDYRKLDYVAFKNFRKFGDQVKKLLNQFRAQFQWSVWPSVLSNNHFKVTMNKLTNMANFLNTYYGKIREKAEIRLKKTKKIIENLKDKLKSFNVLSVFKHKPQSKVGDQFKVTNFLMSEHYPGNWENLNKNIEGKKSSTHQKSQIKGKNTYGTILYTKGKEYWDFILNVNVLTRKRGSFGVIFRMEDAYNFYAYEINLEKEYKQLVQVKYGHYKVIKYIHDGGMPQNEWYKIQIMAKQHMCIIKTGSDKKFSNYDALPEKIKFNEVIFVHGKIAMFTNDNSDFYFNNLKVNPLKCRNNWQVNPNKLIAPPFSNMFCEDFELTFRQKYDVFAPSVFEKGPARWLYAKKFDGREKVLRQSSRVKDKGEFLIPTRAILKNIDVYKRAKINYDFKAGNEGIVGCVFKYKDEGNYFIFEIGGSSNISKRFFRMRIKLDGKWDVLKAYNSHQELSYLPFFGYDINTWYSVEIRIEKQKFEVYVGVLGTTERLKIMTLDVDDKIRGRRIGFSTFGTDAAFSEICVKPPTIPFSEKEIPPIITKGEIEKDILWPEFKNQNQNKKKKENQAKKDLKKPIGIKKFNKKPWKVCINTQSPEKRKKYCIREFSISETALAICEKNFCLTCCRKNIEKEKKSVLYDCNKSCNKYTLQSSGENAKDIWKIECISPPNQERSIYGYCEHKFNTDPWLYQICQLDSCRMCCALNDIAFTSTKYKISSQNQCFIACAGKFPPKNRSIINAHNKVNNN